MKKLLNFFKSLFGCKKPKQNEFYQTLLSEIQQVESLNESVKEIQVIHENLCDRIDKTVKKYQLVINPRLTTSQLKKLFLEKGELSIEGMQRKERQFYAKKIFFLRTRKKYKIFYNIKSQKYYLK
jgi:phosphatidate phosphatase PAH1